MTCKDCIHNNVCLSRISYCMDIDSDGKEIVDIEKRCKKFKNKADFVEVVRCEKCKYGDVSTISKAKDGEEDIACYCTLKKVVTNIDSYCPSGRRRDT